MKLIKQTKNRLVFDCGCVLRRVGKISTVDACPKGRECEVVKIVKEESEKMRVPHIEREIYK